MSAYCIKKDESLENLLFFRLNSLERLAEEAKMSELMLVDLYKQREAVIDYVKGWQDTQILDWMKRFGTIIEPSEGSLPLYTFRSHVGIVGYFYFRDHSEMVVVDSGWLP